MTNIRYSYKLNKRWGISYDFEIVPTDNIERGRQLIKNMLPGAYDIKVEEITPIYKGIR